MKSKKELETILENLDQIEKIVSVDMRELKLIDLHWLVITMKYLVKEVMILDANIEDRAINYSILESRYQKLSNENYGLDREVKSLLKKIKKANKK